MPRPQAPTTPYAGVVKHDAPSHNGAVGAYGTSINVHNHDPGDSASGYGNGVPAWGPSNVLYNQHGPGGGGSGNDWATSYAPNAAIPADPAETCVNPINGLVLTQAAAPSAITAGHGIEARIQRVAGALARLKAVTTISDTVQATPAPSYSGGVATFTVVNGGNFRVGAGVAWGAMAGWVTGISGNQLTATGGSITGAPAAGTAVTQRLGNWWDDVQAVLLGNTPLAGNIVLASGYSVTAPTLVANVVQGTPPLAVVSTTKVASLNVDLVDGFHAWQTNQGGSGGQIGAPTAPTSSAPTAGGTLTVGTAYTWAVTYTTPTGETVISPASVAQTPTSGNQQVALTNIPTGPPTVTSRKIYRNANGGAFGLVGTISDNTTTTFTDTGTAAGAVPPASGNAYLGSLLPALSSDGFLAPGYVDYDAAEATTWDTLTSGQSSIVNSLNRMRNQVNGILAAAGSSWGGVMPSKLVTTITVGGTQAPAGALIIQGAGATTVSIAGNVITISS